MLAWAPSVSPRPCGPQNQMSSGPPRASSVCAQAEPAVTLTVHDDARGQRLTPRTLEALGGPLDIWFCGPQGLGDALGAHASTAPWRLFRESFAMR